MRPEPKSFFTASLILLVVVATVCVWHLLAVAKSGAMSCSTKAIMHFENMTDEDVNANVHFDFSLGGQGSLVLEGYTHSSAGDLYLQRYVKFSWESERLSPRERLYRIDKWSASASSIDRSPDVIFDYFMREMSDSHEGLRLVARKLNEHTVMLSSLSSPLFICTLKAGGAID